MRVIHFVETLPGGPASYLNELIPLQISAGIDVTIYCPSHQAHLVQELPVRVEVFDYKKRTALQLLSLWFQWLRFSRSESFDIVHLHCTFAGLIGRLTPYRGHQKTVYCPHGWAHAITGNGLRRSLYAAVERLLSLRTDRIINISQSEARHAKDAGISDERCSLIYNGLRDASWERSSPLNSSPLKLLFVGRYDKQKGVDLLIGAAQELLHEPFQFSMIGGAVLSKATPLDIPPNCVDLGWKSPQEVRQAMASSDVILMPSRWEGFSLVALEAMRAGRPLVATSVSSLPEAVVDDETGVLVQPESAAALADGIRRIAKMQVSQLGSAARFRFERNFTAEKMERKIRDLYADLVTEESIGLAQLR